jgi:hypothetical protein
LCWLGTTISCPLWSRIWLSRNTATWISPCLPASLGWEHLMWSWMHR